MNYPPWVAGNFSELTETMALLSTKERGIAPLSFRPLGEIYLYLRRASALRGKIIFTSLAKP
jgi:hypothetical protein